MRGFVTFIHFISRLSVAWTDVEVQREPLKRTAKFPNAEAVLHH